MLYYYLEIIRKKFNPPGFGVFHYLTFRAGAAAVTALIIAFWLGPKIIRLLKKHQIGEAAKLEAPKTHLSKAGTPTMGGLIVLLSVLIPAFLWADIRNGYVQIIMFVTAALGGVGFLDDYLKVVKKKRKGLIEEYKLAGQILIGLIVGGIIYFYPQFIDFELWKLKSSTTARASGRPRPSSSRSATSSRPSPWIPGTRPRGRNWASVTPCGGSTSSPTSRPGRRCPRPGPLSRRRWSSTPRWGRPTPGSG